MNWVSAAVAPPSRSTGSRLTTSKYTSNFARSLHRSASLSPHDHGLHVYLQTRLIVSKCIFKHARLRPPRLHDDGRQVHLQTRSIMASKCISEFTRSRPPSASLSSHDNGFQVHFWVHSISGSKCISKLAQSRPLSASLSSHNHGLQGYL